MDTTKTITHIGLCAGYGGIELGLKRVLPNLRSVALCEIEAFACANLVAKMEAGIMEPAPIWTDLKTFPWAEFRDRVDILTGGYPCQPFSAAGKRLGTEDPRHLWPYIADGIRILRPKLCFFENVEGHISLGLREVIGELEQIGYTTAWGIFSASEVGAPHQRKRVFILAVSNSLGGAAGLSGSLAGHEWQPGVADYGGNQAWPSRPGEPQHAWEPPRVVGAGLAHTGSLGRRGRSDGDEGGLRREIQTAGSCGGGAEAMDNTASLSHSCTQPRSGEERYGKGESNYLETSESRKTQPPMGRDADGPAGGLGYAELCVSCDNRTDELRLLGNGVVPATAERAFRTLLNELNT